MIWINKEKQQKRNLSQENYLIVFDRITMSLEVYRQTCNKNTSLYWSYHRNCLYTDATTV